MFKSLLFRSAFCTAFNNVQVIRGQSGSLGLCARCMSANPPKPRRGAEKLILLHDLDGKIIGTKFMSEAEALAKKKDLILEPFESNSKYPSMKFVKIVDKKAAIVETLGSNAVGKSVDQSVSEKKIRLLRASSRMEDHDLRLKMSQVEKWTKKGNFVRVTVMGKESKETFEEVFNKCRNALSPAVELKQKQISASKLIFLATINPNYSDAETSESTSRSEEVVTDLSLDEKLQEELQKEVESLVKEKLGEK